MKLSSCFNGDLGVLDLDLGDCLVKDPTLANFTAYAEFCGDRRQTAEIIDKSELAPVRGKRDVRIIKDAI